MDELKRWQERLEASLRTLSFSQDGSHDVGHSRRVWRHARSIAAGFQGRVDLLVLLAAAYLHDIVSLKKNDPRRADASRRAAKKARAMLSELEFPDDRLKAVTHAIKAHSHSANIQAETLEARILQDADRLEALGAIGVARLFYTAGQKRGQLFDDTDPKGEHRRRDEARYALDHYYEKLQHAPDRMNTPIGRAMALKGAKFFAQFVESLIDEASGHKPTEG